MREIFTPQGKLMCHLDRVVEWLDGKNVGPILVEVNPINACNHRCYWCYCSQFHDGQQIDYPVLEGFLREFRELGGKAVNWTGGGEPLLYPKIAEAWEKASELGLEQGLFTNGQCLNGTKCHWAVLKLRWIRVSLDAATPETHLKMHGINSYSQIVDNIRNVIAIKNESGINDNERYYEPDGKRFMLGICMSVNFDNYKEIFELCENAKEWGVDYFQVRPILPRPGESLTSPSFWKDNITPEIEKCFELEDGNFSVMYTRYKFEELQMPGKKSYDKCYGGQFVTVVNANGKIMNCMYFLKNPDYVLGSLYEKNFTRIWNGMWQDRIEKLDLSKCQVCCKNNEINKFLYAVAHKPFIHHNFI